MKYLLSIICIFGLVVIALLGTQNTQTNSDYFRVHIRANSNSEIDQNVKYKVRDKVVDYLIPYLSNCDTKEQAKNVIEEKLLNIETVANKELQKNGFSYVCNAKTTTENFPTRTYKDITLESGFYEALILELGTAKGDNWWCVVYPPLCFVNGSSSTNIYKSRILETINKFFQQ